MEKKIKKTKLILSNDDPFGIKKIVLGGAPPSLEVEAEIVVRQQKIRKEKDKK